MRVATYPHLYGMWILGGWWLGYEQQFDLFISATRYSYMLSSVFFVQILL